VRKHMYCSWHTSSPKFTLRLIIIIVGLSCSFPTYSEAARAGGGTYTTMVLSYAYRPARWIARCDPPGGPTGLLVKQFQLSFMFDSGRMTFDQVIYKFPFVAPPSPPRISNVLMIAASASPAPIAAKDVDIADVAFIPTSLDAVRAFIGSTVGAQPVGIPIAPNAPRGVILWYNGDFNGVDRLANEQNTIVSQASVYDDFIVPAGQMWNVTAVFSDNLLNTVVTGASWEIRSGVSEGNGGTLIAFGTTGAPTVTPTGRSGFGFTEFMVQVNGLNIFLNPGTYWLNVTPIGNGTGRSLNSTTSGMNAVGQPPGNDMNAFFNSTFFGTNFTSTANEGQPFDYSMGVIGAGPPQPSFMVFANPATNDFIDGFDPVTMQTVHFDASHIAPATRVFTPGVFPHIWDPNTMYNDGIIGGAGTWDTSSNSWDDLPYAPPFNDTPWDNATHAHDIAVFSGDPGTGIVTVAVPISVGGFQFDISGYNIQGNALMLSAPPGLTPTIDTSANSATISSVILGNGFTKVGSGSLALAGMNNYAGSTIINGGTVLANNASGSGTGSSVVMVNNSGSAIGGTGTVGGPVFVGTGAAVLGGNGMSTSGALTVANNLMLSPGAIVMLALGSAGAHSTLARAAGNWTFAPNQAFTFINLGAQPGPYTHIITGLPTDPGGEASWTITNPGFAGTFTYDGVGNINLNITAVPPPLQLTTAVSRKTHGAAGTFDINLPLAGTPGVECRSGGAGGNHTLVFTFTNNITSGSVIVATTGTASVSGTPLFSGNTMTVNLTNVTNAQRLTIYLSNVTDNFAQVLPDTAVNMGVLLGDTNGNGSVSSSDVAQTKAQSGQPVMMSNFREDVNASGTISSTDVAIVKSEVGTALPP
jgi:autotransporter-associated beta strand protein